MKKVLIFMVLLLVLAVSVWSITLTSVKVSTWDRIRLIPTLFLQEQIITCDSTAFSFDTTLVYRTTKTVYTDWRQINTGAFKYLFQLASLDTFWQSLYADTFIVSVQTSATTDGLTPVYTIFSSTALDTATVYKDFTVPDTNQFYTILPYIRGRFSLSAWADSERVHQDSSTHPTYWHFLETIIMK